MDKDSPFAHHEMSKPIVPSRIVYVLFCSVCHYTWKAPAETEQCINCKGNGKTVRSLVNYETECRAI